MVFDAASSTRSPEVGERGVTGTSKFTHLIRPTPLGATSSASRVASYNVNPSTGVREQYDHHPWLPLRRG